MIRGSEKRTLDNNVDALFVDRWSPRAMSGVEIPTADLRALFEAARWSPSSMNNQPWRILYACRDTAYWPLFFDLLVDANKVWCVNAAALLLFVSKSAFGNGNPCRTHSYDSGAAWMALALQGSLRGYVVHGMQGFDYDRAQVELQIPDGYQVEAMAAIGLPGRAEELPEALQVRETPSDRRPLDQTVCEGPFSF
jgi:hypothetical protein